MIHLDRASATPLTDQIVQQTAGLIQSGQLPAGSRLPSIRKLAATLSVSSATVVAAYDRLTARGLIVEVGTEPTSGALLYGTTGYFLERMGLSSLDQLPPLAPYLPEIDALDGVDEPGRPIGGHV